MGPEERFLDSMDRLGCIGGKKILIALSGGADSVALAELCSRTAGQAGNAYSAARVRHGIRSGDVEDREIEFCRSYCAARNVPFESLDSGDGPGPAEIALETGCGPEQAARVFRHDLLEGHRSRLGFDAIFFAHNLDDNRETLLMRFFSGSGPEGLKGIPPCRDRIRRPLLGFTSSELREFLRGESVTWCEDATNAGNDYLRNRVRNRLVPLLDEIFPGWRKSADLLVERSCEAGSALMELLGEKLSQDVGGASISWNRDDWNSSPEYLKALALYSGMNHLSADEGTGPRISWSLIKEFREAGTRQRSLTAGGFRLDNRQTGPVLETDGEAWQGRRVIRTVDEFEGLLLETPRGLLRTGLSGPGESVEVPRDAFPLDIRWEEGESDAGFRIYSPGTGFGVSLTEKSSVSAAHDADTYIVYIK